GRVRNSPGRHLRPVFPYIISLPDHSASLRVEAEQPAASSNNVDPVTIDGRCRARPGVVTDAPIIYLPLACPENFARLLIQSEGPSHPLLPDRRYEVGHKPAPARPRRSCKAAVYRSAPDNGQSFLGEFIQDARLGPDTVSPFAAPFRPVLGKDGRKS